MDGVDETDGWGLVFYDMAGAVSKLRHYLQMYTCPTHRAREEIMDLSRASLLGEHMGNTALTRSMLPRIRAAQKKKRPA